MAAGSPSQPSPPLEIDCSHPGQSKSPISSTFLFPQALQSSPTTSSKQIITYTNIGAFIIPLNTKTSLTPIGHNKVPANVDGLSQKAISSKVVKGQPAHISYADMVKGKPDSGSFKDPDVPILKLHTLTSTFQGKPAVLFPSTAKSLLVKRLKFVLVGKFSHGRPSLRSVKLFFVKLQLISAINITVYDNKHFFLECSCKEDFYRIWLGLTWFIEGLAMRVFKWFPDFSPLKESSIAPVWINVAGLPLYMFEKSSLMSIAEAAGSPIRVDPRNINRSIVNTAWICVELDVQKNLVEDVWVSFVDDSGKDQLDGFWIKFSYTVVPPFCTYCQHIGHKSDFCKRKNELITQESRLEHSSDVAAAPVADAAETAVDEIAIEYANGETATGEILTRKLFTGVPADFCSIPAGENAARDVFATALEGALGDGIAGMNATAAGMDWSVDGVLMGKESAGKPAVEEYTVSSLETVAETLELQAQSAGQHAVADVEAASKSQFGPATSSEIAGLPGADEGSVLASKVSQKELHPRTVSGPDYGTAAMLSAATKLAASAGSAREQAAADLFRQSSIIVNMVQNTIAVQDLVAQGVLGAVETKADHLNGKQGQFSDKSAADFSRQFDVYESPHAGSDVYKDAAQVTTKDTTEELDPGGAETMHKSDLFEQVGDSNAGVESAHKLQGKMLVSGQISNHQGQLAEHSLSEGESITESAGAGNPTVSVSKELQQGKKEEELKGCWADWVEEEQEQQLAREHNAILEWDVAQVRAFVHNQIEEIKQEIGQTEPKIRDAAKEEKKQAKKAKKERERKNLKEYFMASAEKINSDLERKRSEQKGKTTGNSFKYGEG